MLTNNLMMIIIIYQGGFKGSIEEFKKVVPEAMSAEDWFRFHGNYANGEKIVK